MYGIKEVREVFKDPSYQMLFNMPWLGEVWKGDKPQISELKLRKKKKNNSELNLMKNTSMTIKTHVF